MALTKNERRALELARKIIKTWERNFVCHALEDVEEEHPMLSYACNRLRGYISRQLGGAHTLDAWQIKNGWEGRDSSQRCVDRLAWIDWMLAEGD